MRKVVVAVILLLALCAVSASAQLADVPRTHWAYEAVAELAEKGYVLGYPDGTFRGDRALTRYEFATVVARILQDVNQRLAATDTDVVVTTPTTPTQPTAPTTRGSVTAEDLQQIQKLVDEFKVELTVIGTRLDTIEATVEALNDQIAAHDAILNDEEGALRSTMSDVSKLKKIKVSGYTQVRYQTIDPKSGKTKTEDADFDTFAVRRARVKFTASPTQQAKAVLQIDLAKPDKVTVKDAYFQWAFQGSPAIGPSFQLGFYSWPFGYEVPWSSSRRETPERALVFQRLFPGERDTGAIIQTATDANVVWTLGAFNGTGEFSSTDKNDAKDYLGNVKFHLGDLDLGISGYWGEGTAATNWDDTDKVRYGADLQYFMDNITFKGEYVRGKGFDEIGAGWAQDEYVEGYYAQLNYNLSRSNTLVARYAALDNDPVRPALGEITSWDLGFIRWLDNKTRLKLFYKINDEEFNEFDNDGWIAEWIVTY